jgi:hypothetical protein
MRSKISHKVGYKCFLCRTSIGCLLASTASCPLSLQLLVSIQIELLKDTVANHPPSDCSDSPRRRHHFSVILRACLSNNVALSHFAQNVIVCLAVWRPPPQSNPATLHLWRNALRPIHSLLTRVAIVVSRLGSWLLIFNISLAFKSAVAGDPYVRHICARSTIEDYKCAYL